MLVNNFHDFNYLEITILPDKITSIDNVVDVNWNEKSFNETLLKFNNDKRYKPFEKKLEISKHNDVYLIHNLSDNKFYVNRTNYIDHVYNSNYILVKYNKENLPQTTFPSTRKIDDNYYLNKITFKITNRIYINFELKKKINKDNSETIYRRIYINFNNDKNDKIDNDNINNLLTKCINYF